MALFTKRHYEALAARLKDISKLVYNNECKFSYAVESLATMLEHDNPRFNREKFLDAIYSTEARKAWRIR